MSERPELDEIGGATWWHSRTRYLLAREGAQDKRVLDLACGNGFGTTILAERAAEVVGADLSEGAIEVAERVSAHPRIKYRHLRPGPLPFAARSFDVVVCLETLEHFHPTAQAAFAAELVRVLADDGVLVLSTPVRAVELEQIALFGAVNPWHLHTPAAEEIDALFGALPHRLLFEQCDHLVTAIVPERPDPLSGWAARGLLASSDRPAPLARLEIRSKSALALAPYRAAPAPVGLRAEGPRVDFIRRKLGLASAPKSQLALIAADARAEDYVATWQRRAAYDFISGLAAGARALDLGTSDGLGAAFLAARGADVLGVDREARLVELASRLSPGLRFARALDASASFDLAIALGAQERVPAEALDPSAIGFGAPGHAPALTERRGVLSLDCVATTVLPIGSATPALDRLSIGWTSEFAATAKRLELCARSAEALARADALEATIVLFADFQRRATIAQLAEKERLPPLDAVEPSVALLAIAARLDAAIARFSPIEQGIENLSAALKALKQATRTVSKVQRLVDKARR